MMLYNLSRILTLLLAFSMSAGPAYSQVSASSDGQNLSLNSLSVLSFLGISYMSQQALISGQNAAKLNQSEQLEAKDELLQYDANDHSSLGQKEFENTYPILARYLIDLRRENHQFKNLSRQELLEIAYWRLLKKRKNE